MTEAERLAVIERAETQVKERIRSILGHGQGPAFDPLAQYLAFHSDVTRIQALEILAAAKLCLPELFERELEQREQARQRAHQEAVEKAENVLVISKAASAESERETS